MIRIKIIDENNKSKNKLIKTKHDEVKRRKV